jgi:hypothetical protein
MQISAANLLATQSSQMTANVRGPAATFEPIAFKEVPATQNTATTAASAPAPAANHAAAPAANPTGGYVRPGTNLDIKI